MPEFLRPLQAKAATLAGLAPEHLSEVLVTEYRPGATIGWHRDAPMFGVIVGISLRAPCTFKLRHGGEERPLALELAPEVRVPLGRRSAAPLAAQHPCNEGAAPFGDVQDVDEGEGS